MAQMMRKRGEDHLYRYDPVDFDPAIWEIVEDTPAAPAKPKRSKPKISEPVAEADEPADDDDFDLGDLDA